MKFLNEDINNLFYEKRKGVKKSAQKSISEEVTREYTLVNKYGGTVDKNGNLISKDKAPVFGSKEEAAAYANKYKMTDVKISCVEKVDGEYNGNFEYGIDKDGNIIREDMEKTTENKSKYEIIYDFTDFGGDESTGVREVFEGSWDELRAYIEKMKKEGCYNIEATCIDDCTTEKEEQITEGYTQFEIDDEYEKVIEDIVDRLDDDEKDDYDAISRAIYASPIDNKDLFVVAVKRLSEDTDLLNKIVFGEDEFKKLVDDVMEYIKNT